MRKLIVATLALCLAVSAFAGVGIDWTTQGWGIYLNGSTGTDMEAVSELALTKSDILWQLIFSTDDQADPIDLTNAAGGYVQKGGNDEVLKSRLIDQAAEGAGWDDTVSASDGTSWFVCGLFDSGDNSYVVEDWSKGNGWVYQRVFGGIPAEGVWYMQTELEELNTTWDSKQPHDGLYIDTETHGAILSEQIPGGGEVPEPATMSLLGLGALAMVLRRKLRK